MRILKANRASVFNHRRAVLSATIATAIGLYGLVAHSAETVVTSQAWTPTRTQAFAAPDVQFHGYASDVEKISVTVSLKLRNQEDLDSYTKELFRPHGLVYHRFLTKEQSKAAFAPTAQDAQAVVEYLRREGFTNIKVADNRLLVTADGNVGAARHAFHTSIGRYTRGGLHGLANDTDVQVPANLPQIDQVLGLDTMQELHTYSLAPDELVPAYEVLKSGAHGYYPQEFATVYHAGNTPTGAKTTAAIIGWGDMSNAITDLSKFESDKKLPTVLTALVSTSSTASTDDTGQVEWAMDAQALVGISGGLNKLIFYTDGGSAIYDPVSARYRPSGAYASGMLQAINRAVSDNTAKVINMSWGSNECTAITRGFADTAFQLGVAQGQTFTASSGDNGSYPCSANGNGTYGDKTMPSVSYPASSPFVVAVGGTTLNTTAADAYVSETTWPFGGGGISKVEPTPAWQPSSNPHRELPDLAFNADWTNSPILFYVTASTTSGVSESGYYGNGGTSLSAPLFAGAWARLESANQNTLGFAAPALYAYASSLTSPLPLHDVSTGNNGAYNATVGWDKATGWGSFDIEAVNTFIAKTPGFKDASNSQTKSH